MSEDGSRVRSSASEQRVGVVGGGALGLAAALRLAQAGRKVTVFERESHLGGLATGFAIGGNTLEKFYHHIFQTDTTIIRLIGELGLADRLQWLQPDTSVYWRGQTASLDSPGDVLKFPFLPPLDRVRLAAGLVALKLAPNERPFQGQTAAAWIRRVMGRRVYEVLWEPLLRGKFGERAEEIAMSWYWSRVHERTPSLGYLRGGFQQLYDAFGAAIARSGGDVLTGTAIGQIRSTSAGITVQRDTGEVHQLDQLLVTLPSRLFTQVAEGLPADYAARYPGPDHYGAHVLLLGLDRPLTDLYWLNVNDREFPFLALVEHTNLMPKEDYGGRHLVYLGNYLPMDHPLFRMGEEELLATFLPWVQRINPSFDRSWLREYWVFKAPYAQPIVTTDYLSTLPPHQTPLPGVYLANMAHVYPQDRGQNYSIRLGERMARDMLANAPARASR